MSGRGHRKTTNCGPSRSRSNSSSCFDYSSMRKILSIIFLNFMLSDISLVYDMRKPFALLRAGLFVSSNQGDRPVVELFLATSLER